MLFKRNVMLFVFSLCVVVSIAESQDFNQNIPSSLTEYYKLRQDILNQQYAFSFESDITLTDKEKLADIIIMKAKSKEIEKGLLNPSTFIPSRHIFDVHKRIARSKLFRIIKRMPKGGALHSHDTAMCSTDCLIRFTYRNNLWQCNHTSSDGIVRFKFSRNQPSNEDDLSLNCTWTTVESARSLIGKRAYDKYLRKIFSLYTKDSITAYQNINVVWGKFRQIFSLVRSIVTYEPIWKDYFKMALLEHLSDGVQYLEFRSVLPEVRHKCLCLRHKQRIKKFK